MAGDNSPLRLHTPLLLLILLVLALAPPRCWGRVYERCELARELKERLKVPEDQLATWVCIAHRESTYNTSAVGSLAPGSLDHGLFQISDLFWCQNGAIGGACGVDCASLEDDDIANDYKCATRIYREHQRLRGNGFLAWAVFAPYCSADRMTLEAKYTHDCFKGARITHYVLPPTAIVASPYYFFYK